jgi:hypothetical protein
MNSHALILDLAGYYTQLSVEYTAREILSLTRRRDTVLEYHLKPRTSDYPPHPTALPLHAVCSRPRCRCTAVAMAVAAANLANLNCQDN